MEEPKLPTGNETVTDKEALESIQFFTSPLRFNAALFGGFKIILEKLTSIEARLTKLEEIANKAG